MQLFLKIHSCMEQFSIFYLSETLLYEISNEEHGSAVVSALASGARGPDSMPT